MDLTSGSHREMAPFSGFGGQLQASPLVAATSLAMSGLQSSLSHQYTNGLPQRVYLLMMFNP